MRRVCSAAAALHRARMRWEMGMRVQMRVCVYVLSSVLTSTACSSHGSPNQHEEQQGTFSTAFVLDPVHMMDIEVTNLQTDAAYYSVEASTANVFEQLLVEVFP